MSMLELKNSDKLEKFIKENDDILIDFFADWCRPCVNGAPLFEAKSNDPNCKHIKFVKVNVDNIQDQMVGYNVKTIPLLIRYKNGKEFKRVEGLSTPLLDSVTSDGLD